MDRMRGSIERGEEEIAEKNVNWIIVNMYWISTLRRALENCFVDFLRGI
jgi:hypothetical protein